MAADSQITAMYSKVRLRRALGRVPAGTMGTIVHVYPGGETYEVEFTLGSTFEDHCHAVETCLMSDVEVVNHD